MLFRWPLREYLLKMLNLQIILSTKYNHVLHHGLKVFVNRFMFDFHVLLILIVFGIIDKNFK